MPISPDALRELKTLNDAEIADLLGEILEPSILTPFNQSEDLMDAMAPISRAYRAAYPLT